MQLKTEHIILLVLLLLVYLQYVHMKKQEGFIPNVNFMDGYYDQLYDREGEPYPSNCQKNKCGSLRHYVNQRYNHNMFGHLGIRIPLNRHCTGEACGMDLGCNCNGPCLCSQKMLY